METISQKRVAVHRLLHKLGALPNKADILRGYGVTSTTELSEAELNQLIDRLKKGINNRYSVPADVRKWRSNALCLINECGIYATNNDWSDVNRFMLDSRICGKLLYELSTDELKALCKKLRTVADKKAAQDKKHMLTINPN